MVVLAGCVSLTPAAEQVRVVHDPAAVTNCEYFGPLTRTDRVWGPLPQAQKNNEHVLRDDTAALGGDTLLVLRESNTIAGGPRMVAVAYRCQR